MLEHRYISELIKDISHNYAQLQASMQGRPPEAFNLTKAQSILNEIGLGQIALDDEVNTSIAEQASSTVDIMSIDGASSGLNTNGHKASAAADSKQDKLNNGESSVTKFTE